MPIQIVSFDQREDITVVQFRTEEQDTLEYISGKAGIENGNIKVTEESEGGSVNDLLIENFSDQFIFFSDGDILIGAKQNRVLNTAVFLKPRSKTKIPVSCVERGRWGYRSREFVHSNMSSPSSLRGQKAMRTRENLERGRGHYADQGEVWNYVSEVSNRHSVVSPTDDLTLKMSQRIERDQVYREKIPVHKEANGAAVLLGQELIGFETFNRKNVFAEYFPRIIEAVFFDSLPGKTPMPERPETFAAGVVGKLVDKLATAQKKKFPAVGAGEEMRFDDDAITSSNLVYEKHSVHLCAFPVTRRH
jgi:hypothetical protein